MKKGIKTNNTGYSLKTTDKEPGVFAPGPGKWIKPMDPKKDREMRQYQQFAERDDAKFVLDPEKVIKYNNKKIKALERDNFLNFSTLLIDPTRPETQEHAYKLVKELETEPKKYVEETLALQLTLHRLLQTGQLNGREDLDLLYSILDPDFYLPLYPLWDVNGEFLNSNVVTQDNTSTPIAPIYEKYKDYLKEAQKYALKPNERTYLKYATSTKDLNLAIKIQIAKRLMPGLRSKKTDKEVYDALQTIIEGEPQLLTGTENMWIQKGNDVTKKYRKGTDSISTVSFLGK